MTPPAPCGSLFRVSHSRRSTCGAARVESLLAQLDPLTGAADLRVQVALYDDLPWVDLVYDLKKLPVTDPEPVYVAFPLNLQAPAARYEAAGAIVEAERQQIDIGCRDFYAVQSWVDLSDERRGVTVALPDAPILHFGGFTNHRYLERLPMEQPLLVSWPLNNHWFTNFCVAQGGWLRLRYRLMAHAAPFDPVAATRLGAEAAVEPLVGPVWDRPAGIETLAAPAPLPETASLLSLAPDSVHLVGMRPAPDGRGVLVRLQELAGSQAEVRLSLQHSRVVAAERCDLLGERLDGPAPVVSGSEVRAGIEPRRLLTLRLELAPASP